MGKLFTKDEWDPVATSEIRLCENETNVYTKYFSYSFAIRIGVFYKVSSMIESILIVCIGNICRSPMGEALMKARCTDKKSYISISSAGLGAMINQPADPTAQELMKLKNLDISTHSARQISYKLVSTADLILTMSTEQQKEMEKIFPNACGKIHRLGKWGEYDVIDPYKRSRSIFEHSLALIEQGIEDWYKMLCHS